MKRKLTFLVVLCLFICGSLHAQKGVSNPINFSINGPEKVCWSDVHFHYEVIASNGNYYTAIWTFDSPNVTIVNQSSNWVDLRFGNPGGSNEIVEITAKVQNDYGDIIKTIKKNCYLVGADAPVVSGPQIALGNSSANFSASSINDHYEVEESFYWSVISGNATVNSSSNENYSTVTSTGAGDIVIKCCGSANLDGDCYTNQICSTKTITRFLDPATVSSISGESNLCEYPSGDYQSIYTITAPAGVTYKWYLSTVHVGRGIEPSSSNLKLIGSTNSSSVIVRGIGDGVDRVYCKVSYNGVNVVKEKSIRVCSSVPSTPTYIFSSPWEPTCYYEMKTSYASGCGEITYHWSTDNKPFVSSGTSRIWRSVEHEPNSSYYMKVKTKNACGFSGTYSKNVTTGDPIPDCMWKSTDISDSSEESNRNEKDLGQRDILLYPNPVNNMLNIKLNTCEKGVFKVEVYNSLGAMVFTKEQVSGQMTLDVSSFKKGAYFVRVTQNQNHYFEKVMIQ